MGEHNTPRQQVRKISERPVGRGWLALLTRPCLSIRISNLMPCVLIVVTVETQQLPVAPVGGIVVVVVILVMDCQLTQLCAAKFPSAARTDPRIQLERLRPIALLALRLGAPRLSNNLVLPVASC